MYRYDGEGHARTNQARGKHCIIDPLDGTLLNMCVHLSSSGQANCMC